MLCSSATPTVRAISVYCRQSPFFVEPDTSSFVKEKVDVRYVRLTTAICQGHWQMTTKQHFSEYTKNGKELMLAELDLTMANERAL